MHSNPKRDRFGVTKDAYSFRNTSTRRSNKRRKSICTNGEEKDIVVDLPTIAASMDVTEIKQEKNEDYCMPSDTFFMNSADSNGTAQYPSTTSTQLVVMDTFLYRQLSLKDKWLVATQKSMSHNLSLLRQECMDIRRELSKANEESDRCMMQLEDILSDRPRNNAKEALDIHIHQSEIWRKEMGKRIRYLSQRMDEMEDRHTPTTAINTKECVDAEAVEAFPKGIAQKHQELDYIKLRQKEFDDSLSDHQTVPERVVAEEDTTGKDLKKRLQSVEDSCLDRTMEAIRMANYSLESTHTVIEKMNDVVSQIKAMAEEISSLRQDFVGIRSRLHETNKHLLKRGSFATRDELALVEKQCFQSITTNQNAQRTKFEQFDRFRDFMEKREKVYENNLSQLAHELYKSMEADFSKHVGENTALRKLIGGLQQEVRDLKQAVATRNSVLVTSAEACVSSRQVSKPQRYENAYGRCSPQLFIGHKASRKKHYSRDRSDESPRPQTSLSPTQPNESDVSSTTRRNSRNVPLQDEHYVSDEDEVLEVGDPSHSTGYDQGRKSPKKPDTIVIEEDSEPDTRVPSSENTQRGTLIKAKEYSGRLEKHRRCFLTWHHVVQGIRLYLSFGGAPSPTDKWRSRIPELLLEGQTSLSTMPEVEKAFPLLQTLPRQLSHFVTQAATVDSSTTSKDNKVLESLTDEDLQVKYGNVMIRIHRIWIKSIKLSIKKLSQKSPVPSTELKDLDLATPMSLLINQWTQRHSSNVDILEWRRKLAKSYYEILCSQFQGTLSGLSCNVASCSPTVFLFQLILQPLKISRCFPQYGRFRLTDFGREVISTSWDRLLSSIPYEFFIENAWLEAQSDAAGQVISPLALSHVLATMIFYTSMIQLPEKSSESASIMFLVRRISAVTEWLYDMLVIDGVKASEMSSCEHLRLDQTIVELEGVGSKFVSNLQLDGFFEIAHVVWLESTHRPAEPQTQLEA
uniref:Uncharacterized protein AlNc14C77G5123 n=1 Tax=Albugo laibachii Nc14 TaxID=890382 RepID=F0WES3_9STRA|nr:conserved hypothetical protein [Albugo laibachii Nc14]|eukprot:CCA19705.1 conserved hypothetical protein [Albugo laibachii Nc14]